MSSLSLLSFDGLNKVFACIALIGLTWNLWAFFTSPLKSIPGPFIAKWTNIWRMWRVYNGRAEREQYELHRKHGAAVRLGPNMISIQEPTAIRVIYGRKDLWRKSDFYKVNDLFINKTRVENVFSTRDEAWNGRIMKPVVRLFSMSNMLILEPRIDSTIDYFMKRIDEEFAGPRKACPMDQWMHYFAWDVIGEITFGTKVGFLERGVDIAHQMRAVEGAMDYFSVVGQIPFLDYFFDKNPIYHLGPEVFGPSIAFAVERISARRNGTDGHEKEKCRDMLDMYLDAQKQYPDIVDEQTLLAYIMANVAAGSDTVATELRSILYRLCTHPDMMTKLQEELDNVARSDEGLSLPVSWNDCQKRLPFLDACVREGIRIMPAISLPLERIVPAGGFSLRDGRYLPAGTVVGINPYVMNRHEEVFGTDADEFRPERWLRATDETEEAFDLRLSNMRENEFTFGHGKRQCSGRNLAWLETYKLIATLLLKYDIELADPTRPWKVLNRWFVRQTDMDMVFKKRG